MSEVVDSKEEKIFKIIKALDTWIAKDTSVYMPDFFRETAIPHKIFYSLVHRDPRVTNYYYYVKNVLASRNHHILCTKKKISRYEAEKCAYLMKRYDPDMHEAVKLESREEVGDYERTSDRNLKENLPHNIKKIYEDNIARKKLALEQERASAAETEA